jgi:lysine 2,3-aminomutase
MSLQGKKLLMLGGALYQVPALACAKRLGCHVIMADMNADVPGRPYADEYESVSTRDMERLLAIARQHRVDGVMTYASDSSVASVAYVAEQMGLPGNPPQAAETVRRKDLFREFQKAEGLPHPRFCIASTLAEAIEGVRKLTFPLVVKPADSAGTKGQSVLYGRNEVPYAFECAVAQSTCGRVVIEEFINADMMELDGDIWFHEGRLAFRHYGHNHFLKNRISNVPSGEIFPGFFGEEVAKQLDRQFDSVIRALGLREGCLNFDGFVSRGTVYIIDAGLRNGGNFVPDLIELSTGFSLTEAALHSALNVPYSAPWLSCPQPAPVASYLIGSRFEGRYEGVDFDPLLRDHVVEMRPFLKEGDEIGPYTRSDFAAGIVFMKFPDMETLHTLMDQIEELVNLHVAPIPRQRKEEAARPAAFKAFLQQISPFLRKKFAEAETAGDQNTVRVLTREYVETASEDEILPDDGLKHYEAGEHILWEGQRVNGIERLYRRVMLFELVQQCATRCRYCLRRNYETWNHSRQDILHAARYIGQSPGSEVLREVLVTGGDPGIVPDKLELFLDALAESAPQILVARVATRVPIHQPDLVNDRLLAVLSKKRPFRVEVATQINHAVELFPEVEDAYRRILAVVPTIYNQAVILKGINDSFNELIDLCDRVRALGLENHYMFHCVPIGGLCTYRTTLARTLELARHVSQSGYISGRAKPKFALMTGIGKITLYDGTVIDRQGNRYLLRSEYSYADRLEWNPSYQLPPNAFADATGRLCIWYEDADE